MFSLNRVFATAILPDSRDYTFWGKEFLKVIPMLFAKSKVLSMQDSTPCRLMRRLNACEQMKCLNLPLIKKHKRVCYVVAERGRQAKIKDEIISMPGYFADYDTTVYFVVPTGK